MGRNKYARQSSERQKAESKARMCDRKVAFPTEADAYQKNQHVYHCPHCGLWHRSGKRMAFIQSLTKKPKRK